MHRDKHSLMYEVGQALASVIDIDELLPSIIQKTKELSQVESAAVMLLDEAGEELLFPYVEDEDPSVSERLRDLRVPRDRGVAGWVVTNGESALVPDVSSDPRFYGRIDDTLGRTTQGLVCVPLRTRSGIIGVLEVINKRDGRFTTEDVELLEALSGSVAIAIDNARLFAAVRGREATLQREVTSLRRIAGDQNRIGDIIAASPAMQEVLRLIESAADSPIDVLIEGETGTGKEVVAKAIHYASARQGGAFVAVNCAALNENLLESELFGHRKGAFTGALKDKKGLFEVADQGTLFLDEIGETSAGMQAKLLRVLQEGEFLPVGETSPRRVKVRIIAATNRDLMQQVETGQFREDLYYRVSTFPIRLPPLRQRPQDIPLLVDELCRRAAERFDREVRGVEPAALALLEGYLWPGNVRELENELQRAVSLTPRGAMVSVDQISAKVRGDARDATDPSEDAPLSLRAALERFECDHLKRALAANSGNVSHAARALGISRVQLQRKMKAMGLRDKSSRPIPS